MQETEIRTGNFHGVSRSEISLSYLPNPDFYAFKIPSTHCILLTNDGTELTQKVFSKLAANDQKVAVLNLPNVSNPIKANAVNLEATTDAAIAEALEKIRTAHGEIGSFIHLHPHFEFQNGNFVQHFQAERAVVKTVFFLAKHLKQPLNDLAEKQRAGFMTVTRMDGKLGMGKRGNVSVVGGGIKGLVKCLNLEWSPVFCRAVDIQPELSKEVIADQIIAEFHDANLNYTEVAFSEEGRKTTHVEKVQLIENQEIKTKISENSVFLVSGGAKGVTAKCVIEMAKSFQCKFILLGRSDFTYEIPDFAKNTDNEGELKRLIMNDLKDKGEKPSLPEVKRIFKNIVAKKEIETTISTVKNHGAQVEYIKGDVTNPQSFSADLKAAVAKFGKITGVIHGAGRLADKYIQDKSEADFENVLSVKLDGLLSLFQSVDIHHLDHLILFSSVAGFYGNIGQTDYAIANEILSNAAHLFKTNHPNTHVSAINWGAWDSGMVSGELKAQFEAYGVELVDSEGGAALLVNELNHDYFNQPQCIIGGTLPAGVSHIGAARKHNIHRKVTLAANNFLNHHVIQGKPVLPVVNGIGWISQSCQRLYPDFKIHKIENSKLFKGLVFDETVPENFLLELTETAKSEKTIVFDGKVSSQAEGKKLPTFHYGAKVTLVHKNEVPPIPKHQHQSLGETINKDGATLYKDGTLFHGAHFQGIEKLVEASEKGILIQCKAPAVPLEEQGQFPAFSVNTYYSDIIFQGLVIWTQLFKDGAKGLPVKSEEVIIYKKIPFNKRLFSSIKIEKDDGFNAVANCQVFDEAGNVYMTTKGATLTFSRDLEW